MEALLHILMNIFRQSSAAGKRGKSSSDGFDGRERVVQLMSEHADQTLPCLALLCTQGATHVRDNQEFVRNSVFPKRRMAHCPAAMLAGESGFDHLGARGLKKTSKAKIDGGEP